MRITKGRLAAVVVAVASISLGATGAANAATPAEPGTAMSATSSAAAAPLPANSVGPTQIIEGGVWGGDVHDNTLPWKKLGSDLRAEIRKAQWPTGKVTGLEADGPYPGSTKLQDHPGNGANSTEKVPADGKSHAVWVMCAAGKSALGGGYRVGADQGDAVAAKIQVTASEPTQVKDGAVVYAPIAGDAAGSMEPNGWLVEVINTGTVDATVRPWVTCAKVAK